MRLRLDGMAVGAGVVGVIAGFNGFVADDAVECAQLEIKAVAHRGAQRGIGLPNGEITRPGAIALTPEGLGVEPVGIRPEPQVGAIASRPILLVQRLFDAQLDDVQVEAVGLINTPELIGRQVVIAGAKVPLC